MTPKLGTLAALHIYNPLPHKLLQREKIFARSPQSSFRHVSSFIILPFILGDLSRIAPNLRTSSPFVT
jgi:hypothetical protein